MTEVVVRGTFLEVVPSDDMQPGQPALLRSKTSGDAAYLASAPDSALYVHVGSGWQRTKFGEAQVLQEEEEEDEDEAVLADDDWDDDCRDVASLPEDFDMHLVLGGARRRGRTTTESSDGSYVGIPHCTSSKSTCLSVCLEEQMGEGAGQKREPCSPPAIMGAAMAEGKRSMGGLAAMPASVHLRAMPTACVNRTFIEVNSASSGDEEQPGITRSKTSSDAKSLVAVSSGSLPLYVNDGLGWRKAEGACTTGTLPVCIDDYDDVASEASDAADVQVNICRTQTASPHWDVAQERMAREALRIASSMEQDAPSAGTRRKSTLFSTDSEVHTYNVEEVAEEEDEETPEGVLGQSADGDTADQPRKLTSAQRTNRRRAEKRRQRRLAAESNAQADSAPAGLAAYVATAQPQPLPSDGDSERTTVTLRNLPSQYSRAMLLDLLDMAGFRGRFDFVYLPLDFQTYNPLGFAFVNFLEPSDAFRCFECFQGFCAWGVPSTKQCVVVWAAANQQGLASNIERYRNTSLMHSSVAEERKPLLLVEGMPVPFPAPTRRSWRPNPGAHA